MAYIFFAISTLIYPVAIYLEKKGMTQIGSISGFGNLFSWHTFVSVITNPFAVGGVTLSVFALIFWLGSMATLKVSYLYPVGGGIQQVLLFVLAITLLGETATIINWVGVGTIITGIVLLNI